MYNNPLVLSLSKDERLTQDMPFEDCRSWFDKLTTNGRYHMHLFKVFARRPLFQFSANAFSPLWKDGFVKSSRCKARKN